MVILLVSEVFLAMEASVLSACNIETSIADTLQLRDFTKHGTHLLLRFITQMGIRNLVKILRNLYLHIIRNTFILLNTTVKFAEFIHIFLTKQLTNHTKHTLDTLCKRLYLF